MKPPAHRGGGLVASEVDAEAGWFDSSDRFLVTALGPVEVLDGACDELVGVTECRVRSRDC